MGRCLRTFHISGTSLEISPLLNWEGSSSWGKPEQCTELITQPVYKVAANHFSLVPRPRLAFRHLQYGKAGGPGILFHVSDVRIERMIIIARGHKGPRTAKEPQYQVTYHTYLASGGRQLSFTLSIEPVVG